MARPAHKVDATITASEFLEYPSNGDLASAVRASNNSREILVQKTTLVDTKVRTAACVVECPSCSISYGVDPSLIAGPVAGATHAPRFQCTRCNSVFLALPESQWKFEAAVSGDLPATTDTMGDTQAGTRERRNPGSTTVPIVQSAGVPPVRFSSVASRVTETGAVLAKQEITAAPTSSVSDTAESIAINSVEVLHDQMTEHQGEQDQPKAAPSRYSWKNKDQYLPEPDAPRMLDIPHAPHENTLNSKPADANDLPNSGKWSWVRVAGPRLLFSSLRDHISWLHILSSLTSAKFTQVLSNRREREAESSQTKLCGHISLCGNIGRALLAGAEKVRDGLPFNKISRYSHPTNKGTSGVGHIKWVESEFGGDLRDTEIYQDWRDESIAISSTPSLPSESAAELGACSEVTGASSKRAKGMDVSSISLASPINSAISSNLSSALSIAYSQNSGEAKVERCEQFDSHLSNKMSYDKKTSSAELIRMEANTALLPETRNVANGGTRFPIFARVKASRSSPALRTVWDSSKVEHRSFGGDKSRVAQAAPPATKQGAKLEEKAWEHGKEGNRCKHKEVGGWRDEFLTPSSREKLSIDRRTAISTSGISTFDASKVDRAISNIATSNITTAETRETFRGRPSYFNSSGRAHQDLTRTPITGNGDGLPPSGQLGRILRFSIAPAAIVLLLIAGVTIASFYSRQFAHSVDKLIFSNAVQIPPAGVFVEDAILKEVTLDSGEKLFVISGSIRNESSKTLREIAVEGILFSRDGIPVSREVGYAGTPLADSIITSLSMEMIDSLQGADQGAITILEPNKKIPFVVAIKPPAPHIGTKDQDIPERTTEEGTRQQDPSLDTSSSPSPPNHQPSPTYYSVRTYSVRPSNNPK